MATNNAINLSESGMTSYDGISVFHGRTLTAGTGVSITNGDGISGNPTISASASVPITFTEDAGTATPSASNLNIFGNATQGISTSGSGSTVTITASNATAVQKGVASFNLTEFSVVSGAVASNDFTITAGTGLSGGGSLNLGGSTTISLTTPVIVANGGTGSTSFNINGAVYSNTSTTGPLQARTLNDGQLLIGATGTAPTAANLTAGTGISITNAANSITINATGALTWTDKAISFLAVSNNGYFCTAALAATLPASPSQGDIVEIISDVAGAITITGNTGQKIRIGSALSGAAGTAVSNARGDSIKLVYRSSGTTWFALSAPQGTWTVT